MKIQLRNLILSLALSVILASSCKESETAPQQPNALNAVERAEILPLAETPETEETIAVAQSKMVWYCKSSGAKRYHLKENCSGLKRCKHTIEKQSQKEAEALGLTLCQNEY